MITRRSARQALKRAEVEAEPQVTKNDLKKKQERKSYACKKSKIDEPTHAQASKTPPVEPTVEPARRVPVSRKTVCKKESDPEPVNEVAITKRAKYACLDFRSVEIDPIIDDLRESFDDPGRIVDDEILVQIALEGLAGITFGRLLRILDAIFPRLASTHNENSQRYIWSIMIDRYLNYPKESGVSAFYLNPENQDKATSLNSESSPARKIIIDKPIKLPSQTLERMARKSSSLHPVQEGSIMGSCASYPVRVDISEDLTNLFNEAGALGSIHLANSRYGLSNIFFVAAQNVRNRSLLPEWVDPNMDIKLREYCALEFIGKSRSLGAVFPNDKTLGRYRLMLLAKNFISQHQQNNSCPIVHHLKRFTREKTYAIKDIGDGKECKALFNYDKKDDAEPTISELCCNPSKLKPDRSVLSMVYDVIAQSAEGITQIDIRRRLHMPKFHLRNHLKNLLSLKMVCSYANKDPENPFRIYKSAHKFRRKLNAIENTEKLKGIMANWDEADLRAKRIIGHKRSSFSQAEDSLLILCRITSILIDPKCRLSWCVNKRLIRDLLHNELVESHDKTSDACLRRIKYLKRLPNNIMSINELTAELQDDPSIIDIIGDRKNTDSDHKLNKLFTQLLNIVRAKIPNLLGITSAIQTTFGHQILAIKGPKITDHETILERRQLDAISSHKELFDRYELIDCQSVAAINRAPTYEQAKNQIDVKFNNVALVTMAFTLATSLEKLSSERSASPSGDYSDELNLDEESRMKRTQTKRKIQSLLLEKFYSGYPDKLVNSVLSKLNKRSLLTRKCPAEQASLYKPKTKMSLKLNQSVLFLLNRYQSSSLVQLARPINQLHELEMEGSNEMASIALLTSLCSFSSFNLNLELEIPSNVVAIDQGNENFKNLCAKANERVREILFRVKQQDFRTLYKCGSLADCLIVQPCNVRFQSKKEEGNSNSQIPDPVHLIDASTMSDEPQQQATLAHWIVKSFSIPRDKEFSSDKDHESNKVAIEYHARLWRSIDGSVNTQSLFKLIESLLSWITVFPGVELDLLKQEFSHLMPQEHLLELLDLMEKLALISSQQIVPRSQRPRLFGSQRVCEPDRTMLLGGKVYEPTANSYIRYCQLLNHRYPTVSDD